MKKKTVVSLAVATILALTSLTGCGNSKLSGTVATDGSGSGITAVSEGRCDIGEAMAVMLVSGNVPNMPSLFQSVRFLTTAVASEMSYSSGLQRQAENRKVWRFL